MMGKAVLLTLLMLTASLQAAQASAETQEIHREVFTPKVDGFCRNGGNTYKEVQGASSSAYVFDAFITCGVGQDFTPSPTNRIKIWRAFLTFDTSKIPDEAVILEAQLSLYGAYDYSDTDFNILIQLWTGAEDGLTSEDYSEIRGPILGKLNTGEWRTDGYNNVTITGLNHINLEGATSLALLSDRDLHRVSPEGHEQVSFYSKEEGGGHEALLEVTYTLIDNEDERRYYLEKPRIATGIMNAEAQNYVSMIAQTKLVRAKDEYLKALSEEAKKEWIEAQSHLENAELFIEEAWDAEKQELIKDLDEIEAEITSAAATTIFSEEAKDLISKADEALLEGKESLEEGLYPIVRSSLKEARLKLSEAINLEAETRAPILTAIGGATIAAAATILWLKRYRRHHSPSKPKMKSQRK